MAAWWSMAMEAMGGCESILWSLSSSLILTAGEAVQSITKSTSGIGLVTPIR